MIRLTFYTKPNCPLCDEARDLLEDLKTEFSLTIQEVNIFSSPALYEKYKYIIPVVAIDGGPTFPAWFSEADLRRAFRQTKL